MWRVIFIFLFLLGCGNYQEDFLWDRLSPEAQEGIRERAANQCEQQYERDFQRLIEETLRSFQGDRDLIPGRIFNWFEEGDENARSEIVILDIEPDYILFFLEQLDGTRLIVHDSTSHDMRVYKVSRDDNNNILRHLQSLACTNQDQSDPNEQSFFENRAEFPQVVTIDITSDDINNRTLTTYTYEMDREMPSVMSLFAYTRSVVTIEEGVRISDNTFSQRVRIAGFREFDQVYQNKVNNPSVVEHCDFTTTTWEGKSLSIPKPRCANDNAFEEEIQKAFTL